MTNGFSFNLDNPSGRTKFGSDIALRSDIAESLKAFTSVRDVSNTQTLQAGGTIEFPILTNPSAADDLLMGKNADLFNYTFPSFNIKYALAEAIKTPIYGPFTLAFGGTLDLNIYPGFDFDTKGFESGSSKNLFDAFKESFYIKDPATPDLNIQVVGKALKFGRKAVRTIEEKIITGYKKVEKFIESFDPFGVTSLIREEVMEPITKTVTRIIEEFNPITNFADFLLIPVRFDKIQPFFLWKEAEFTTAAQSTSLGLVESGEQTVIIPPKLASLEGDTLWLNMGPRWTLRQTPTFKVQDVDETFSVRQSFSSTTVSAFGFTVNYPNSYSEIRADGGEKADRIFLNVAIPTFIRGGTGDDEINGGSVKDTLWGGANNDTLCGNNGNDELYGDTGIDYLYGGDGNDSLTGGADPDYLFGQDDVDTVLYLSSHAGVTIDLASGLGFGGDAEGDRLQEIENVIGSQYSDLLVGDSNNNLLEGEAVMTF